MSSDAVRQGDIFSFCYSQAERQKLFEPHHCFDGQLVAIERPSGIILLDTYWLYQFQYRGDDHGRRFTVDEARALGELTLKCNLDEVEFVRSKEATVYFDDADVFDLSCQHHCHPYFAVRKGAVRSQTKMAAVIAERIEAANRKIASENWTIERLTAEAAKVERGELSEVYL